MSSNESSADSGDEVGQICSVSRDHKKKRLSEVSKNTSSTMSKAISSLLSGSSVRLEPKVATAKVDQERQEKQQAQARKLLAIEQQQKLDKIHQTSTNAELDKRLLVIATQATVTLFNQINCAQRTQIQKKRSERLKKHQKASGSQAPLQSATPQSVSSINFLEMLRSGL